VLDDNELREGIKKFSNWPTIPQLYVNGEFVGGCDVLWEAHESGDFESLVHAPP
jgi:monothiol glutaredoxin